MDNLERINKLKTECLKPESNVKPTIEELFLKDENGKTLFEFMVSNKAVFNRELLDYLTTNYDYLKYMIENGVIPSMFSDYRLLLDTSKGMPIINLLFQKSPSTVIYLPKKVINYLFNSNQNRFIIEDLLKINELNCEKIIKRIDDYDLLYNCFSKIGRLDLFKYANEECLLHQLSNGKTVIEGLIDNNITIQYISRDSYKLADILYKNGKYNELLQLLNSDILLNYPTKDNNYLDLLINKYKNGENIDFNGFVAFSSDYYSMAKVYLTLAKNGISFNRNISDTDLIVHMLKMDQELTLKIFNKKLIVDAVKRYANVYFDELYPFYKKYYDNMDLLSLKKLLELLPSKEKLLNRIKSGKIEIKESDTFHEDFLEPFENEETLLEYALKNNIKIFNRYRPATVKEVLLFVKYKKKINTNIKEDLLYERVNDNELLIDVLIKNNYIDLIRHSIIRNMKIMDYCIKYNRYDFLNNKILDELFATIDGTYDALKYLNNSEFIKCLNNYEFSTNTTLNLIQKGYLNALVYSKEKTLLAISNNKTILENLLENGMNPTFGEEIFKSEETIKLLYKYKRSDLMYHASLNLLLNYPTKENNMLQYMIASYKNGVNVHFELGNYLNDENSKNDIARFYIEMAREGLIRILNPIDEHNLLLEDANGKSILSYLIDIDRETTLSKVLDSSIMSSEKVNAALKVLSGDGLIDLSFKKFDCDGIYRDIYNQEYDKGMVSPVEDLLKELRHLFATDKLSNMEIVDALIKGYRYATCNDQLFIEEIRTLINIKKENPNFHFRKEPGGAYFSSNGNYIACDTPVISTLMHEIGHAIHYYTTNYEIPSGYAKLEEEIRNSPDWPLKVENFAKKYEEIKKEMREKAKVIVERSLGVRTNFVDDIKISILLSKQKQSLMKDYLNKGYSKETLETILSKSFTKDEFLKQKKEVEENELLDFFIRADYSSLVAIGDFIDAICNGEYCSNVAKNKDGKIIPAGAGHGMQYYSYSDNKFLEMVANYSQIIKAKDSKEAIILLRQIMGDELIDMIDIFYRRNMIRRLSYDEEVSWSK